MSCTHNRTKHKNTMIVTASDNPRKRGRSERGGEREGRTSVATTVEKGRGAEVCSRSRVLFDN